MSDGTTGAEPQSDLRGSGAPGKGAISFLLYRDADGREHEHQLSGRVTIGRSPGVDVLLEWDMSVSRVHAEMECLGDDWTIIDDGLSRNGTYVNGERLNGRRRLRSGDSLRIGETLLVFHEDRHHLAGGTVMAADAPPAASLSPTQKQVLIALCRPYRDAGPYATPASNQQIAQELYLSVDAVKTHLRTLFPKFNVEQLPQNQKRAKLVEVVLTSGIITPHDLSAP